MEKIKNGKQKKVNFLKKYCYGMIKFILLFSLIAVKRGYSQNGICVELNYEDPASFNYQVLDSVFKNGEIKYVAFGELHFHSVNDDNIRLISDYMISRQKTECLAYEISPTDYYFWYNHYMRNDSLIIERFYKTDMELKKIFETLRYLKTRHPEIRVEPLDMILSNKAFAQRVKFVLMSILDKVNWKDNIFLSKLYSEINETNSSRKIYQACFDFKKSAIANGMPELGLKQPEDSLMFFNILYSYTFHKGMKFPKIVFNKRLSRIREKYLFLRAADIMARSKNPVVFVNGMGHVPKEEGLWFGEETKGFISSLEKAGIRGVSVINYYKGDGYDEKAKRYNKNFLLWKDISPYLNKEKNYLLIFKSGYYKMFDWAIINNI